jgi:toxin CcdB
MAKFDVYRHRNGSGYLLDLQADILSGLNTRFVAPLLPLSDAPCRSSQSDLRIHG